VSRCFVATGCEEFCSHQFFNSRRASLRRTALIFLPTRAASFSFRLCTEALKVRSNSFQIKTFHFDQTRARCSQPELAEQSRLFHAHTAEAKTSLHSRTSRRVAFQGLCRCHDNYLGLDCSVASSKLNKPSFWNLEWDRVPNRPTGAREPPLLYGHCMVTFKNSLWVFGGMSDAGAVASMYR